MTHHKKKKKSVKDRPESESEIAAGEVLTKAIQACLTSLHSYCRNAGWGKVKKKKNP